MIDSIGLLSKEEARKIKEKNFKNIPIIILTAKGENEDKVKGLNSGADDYITKPFSFPELLARIKALLRRSKPSLISDIIEFEDLKVDRITRRVFRKNKETRDTVSKKTANKYFA